MLCLIGVLSVVRAGFFSVLSTSKMYVGSNPLDKFQWRNSVSLFYIYLFTYSFFQPCKCDPIRDPTFWFSLTC